MYTLGPASQPFDIKAVPVAAVEEETRAKVSLALSSLYSRGSRHLDLAFQGGHLDRFYSWIMLSYGFSISFYSRIKNLIRSLSDFYIFPQWRRKPGLKSVQLFRLCKAGSHIVLQLHFRNPDTVSYFDRKKKCTVKHLLVDFIFVSELIDLCIFGCFFQNCKSILTIYEGAC